MIAHKNGPRFVSAVPPLLMALSMAMTFALSACGERRDRQGVRVGTDETSILPAGDDSATRKRVGGDGPPEFNEAVYLKEDVSIETLRQLFAADISADHKVAAAQWAREHYFNLAVMYEPVNDVPGFRLKWIDDSQNGKARVQKTTTLELEAKSGDYIGNSDNIPFRLSCLSKAKRAKAVEANRQVIAQDKKNQDSEFCEVARLEVQDISGTIPYLVVTRIASIENTKATLVSDNKTITEFTKFADGRSRHHLIALADEVQEVQVTNTISVLSDDSLFGVSMWSPTSKERLRIWGAYTRVNQVVGQTSAGATQAGSVVRSEMDPVRSTRYYPSAILTENQRDYFSVGFFYDTSDPAASRIQKKTADEQGVVEFRFQMK